MRKTYRITGSSLTKPDNLPDGFEVRERLVGEILGTSQLVFREVKDGSMVVYRQGVAGTNVKLSWEEVQKLAGFLVEMVADKKRRDLRSIWDGESFGLA